LLWKVETDIANVRPRNPVAFTVDSYPSRDFPGIVESIAPKATIVSGVVNYEVTINIRTDAQLLKPDLTANVSIQTVQHEALLVPSKAVQHDGEQTFVYVSAGNGPQRKAVVTGTKTVRASRSRTGSHLVMKSSYFSGSRN
jgi:HlyD family secretion protein